MGIHVSPAHAGFYCKTGPLDLPFARLAHKLPCSLHYKGDPSAGTRMTL